MPKALNVMEGWHFDQNNDHQAKFFCEEKGSCKMRGTPMKDYFACCKNLSAEVQADWEAVLLEGMESVSNAPSAASSPARVATSRTPRRARCAAPPGTPK